MISSEKLFSFLKKKKIDFFVGVPDSVLKYFIKILQGKKHIIAANEGSAVSIGIGNYLSTKKIPLVYMQNSGLGNAINPLISIAHKKVYSIPLLLMIGWRGAPSKFKDEPQHNLKGKITIKILKLLNIKYCIINNEDDFKKLNHLINFSLKNKTPVAFLIKNHSLINKKKFFNKNKEITRGVQRSFVIEELLKGINKTDRIISTTGFTSRELFQIRNSKNYKSGKDFYMIGGMGHSSSVTLGYSLSSNYRTICLDGDGSLIMHLGSLISTGFKGKKNFKHILLNNASHESVGNQKIDTQKINFKDVTKSFGYKNYYYANSKKLLLKNLDYFLKSKGPSFLEIYIKPGSLSNLSRPKNFIKIKNFFINK
jgi:phosphonopyruvate decarboxylase